MLGSMNKTKVIATIGPVSKDINVLREMIQKGTNVVRLNLSHSSHEFCTDIINKVRTLNKELHSHVGILLDTKGPDIRVGKFIGGSATLEKGEKIRIYMNEIMGDGTKFSIDYPGLLDDVNFNTVLKLNDGLIELLVVDKKDDCLVCEVVVGGVISDHKALNAPGIKTNISFLSSQDLSDIKYAVEMDVDFLALSFVSSQEDVLQVNDRLIEFGNDHIELIAKIENEEGVNNLDEIIDASDGIMVARGDLSVELPMERVPGIQKQIIRKCHMNGKISIVATEMLSSMENTIRPTKAEVSDIANAVIDGTDAVMLSGETTVGKYPIETIETMSKIIASAEESVNYIEFTDLAIRTGKQDITGMISYSVVESANRLKCKAIITPTMSGYTAKMISRFRPSCLIIAVSPNIETVSSLSLRYGIQAMEIDELNSFDKVISKSQKIAYEVINAMPGDKVIITGGYPFREVKHTNFMKIEEL